MLPILTGTEKESAIHRPIGDKEISREKGPAGTELVKTLLTNIKFLSLQLP